MSQITIQNIQFFTPALVTYKASCGSFECEVKVDYRSREIRLPDDAPPEIADLFFPFLNESLHTDSNLFEANEEVYENAQKATDEFEKTHKDHLGADNA